MFNVRGVRITCIHRAPPRIWTSLSRWLRAGALFAEYGLRRLDDAVRLESEFPLQFLERRRRPEGLHADDLARGADVALPPEGRRLLHGDAGRHRRRQHAVPVRLRLALEQIPRRHRDDTRANALG